MKEQESRQELDERLRTLIKTRASGVKGLEPLIQSCVEEIMERAGVKKETYQKLAGRNGGEKK